VDLPDGLGHTGQDTVADAALGPGRYAELTVADTGVGMPSSVTQRIFEPFFSTKGDAGTGLGLAIVHGLVTGAGGAIEVASAPDRGTTFRILLPAAAGEPDRRDRAPASGAAGEPRHVLLVEDEPMIRRMAQTILERAGHRVTTAGDGVEALAALERLRGGDAPDVVITDVVMPGMSGIELANRIRERHADLPIAFASGYDQGLLPTEGPFAGARLLEKPYSPSVLVALVGELAGRPAGG
jgi:CheY-like chemotaxis protein